MTHSNDSSFISSGSHAFQNDQDIIGLSIVEASAQYITKFQTLRTHLFIADHPIAKIINTFREQIRTFISDSETGIKQYCSFYDKQGLESEKAKMELIENEKLLKRLVRDIKLFVALMHDTVVRFYQLDIKMASDVSQGECLTNLLTSLVLKSPIYNSVHALF